MSPWILYIVTGYSAGCIMPRSGKEHSHLNPAAYGKLPEANWSVAAPPHLPFGTVLELSYQGIITTRIVHDRGRDIVAVKGKPPRMDLFMDSCKSARRWGVREVWVREVRRPLAKTPASPLPLPLPPLHSPLSYPIPTLAAKSKSVK